MRVTALFMWLAFLLCQTPNDLLAADWANARAANSQSSLAVVDEAYLEHIMKPNGDLDVREDIEMTITEDMRSLIFIFDYSAAIDLEMTSVTISIDTGEGYSVPVGVQKRTNGVSEAVLNSSELKTTYQLVRSSDQESLHIIQDFVKGSRVKINLSYQLTGAADRYRDAGLLRRYLVVEDFDYQIKHMEAVFIFPPLSSGDAIDFDLYPFYRWQNPLNYEFQTEANQVRVELFDVSARYSFELVVAFPEDTYPLVVMVKDEDILPRLEQQSADIRQREETAGVVSSWFDRSILHIVLILSILALVVAGLIYFSDVMRGRKNKIGPYLKYPPLGISPAGLSFLMRRKVTGQDLYAVMIELVNLGLFNYEKNIFTLATPQLPEDDDAQRDLSPQQDPITGLWTVYGRKGAVSLDQNRYVIWKALSDVGRDLDGFSPSALEKMSRKNEYSNIYYRFIADYAKACKDELTAKQIFDTHMRRTILLFTMSIVYVVSAVALFILTLQWMAWLILVPAVCMTVLTMNIRSLSGLGHWTLHHALLFKHYLTHFSDLPEVEHPASDVLVTLLIYAISFGCEAEYLDEVYKTHSQEELINLSFYRQTGTLDLFRSSLVTTEKDRQGNLLVKIKQRFREGRVDMIGVVFNSKHFSKL